MKAVVKYGKEDGMVELRDVPVPEVGANDVLLEVHACGICGSDVEMWKGYSTNPINLPVIMGHEFCGIIGEVGSGVKEFKPGDRVVSETSAYVCGKCDLCRTGNYNLCPDRLGFGYGTDGAFTRYVKVREEILHRIPGEVSFEEAAITEPVCVAYNAVAVNSHIKPGETVMIIGPGPIGLNSVQIAKVSGAGKVIVAGTGVDASRLKLAEILGADIVIDSQEKDVVEEVLDITKGSGADLVIDAAGSPATLKQSLDMVKRSGQITKIGWGLAPVDFSLDPLILKAVTLQGSYSHNWNTWKNVLRLMEIGKVKTKLLISHILPITEWEKGYKLVESREATKVILKPVGVNNAE